MTKNKNTTSTDQKLHIPKSGPKHDTLSIIPGTTKQSKFEHMIGIGYDDAKIMSLLSISRTQFDHMKMNMEETVANYMRFQTKSGHMQNLKNALEMEYENAYALKIRAEVIAKQCSIYPEDRKLAYAEGHLRQTFSNVLNSAYTMQRMVPLAQGFALWIKEHELKEGQTKAATGNKISFLPEELTN